MRRRWRKINEARIDTATCDHAADIALIAAEALSVHIDVNSARVQQLLSESLTYVALVDGRVIGFVDCFITRCSSPTSN